MKPLHIPRHVDQSHWLEVASMATLIYSSPSPPPFLPSSLPHPFLPSLLHSKDRLTAEMDEVLAYSRPLFNGADENGDGQLTMKEYAAFMHPEIHPHMIDTLVQTFLEQFDNNDDGYISFYEYMG